MDGTQIPYDIPAQHVDYVRAERGVDVGFWRSVGPGYTRDRAAAVAPAIANAVFTLTGARLRALPFLPDRVKAAVAAA